MAYYIPRGKVVMTTVTADGKSIFDEDGDAKVTPLTGASIRKFYALDKIPQDGLNQSAHVHAEDFNSRAGASFVECEMEPGEKSPFHATPSIDFGVVISGEIVLILDDGIETVLK
jgi:hypothetical protein